MASMTVRDLIKREIDIDVCDDYDERVYMAFCGPAELTPEGEEYFEDALDTKIDPFNDIIILNVEDDVKILNKLYELFSTLAGYCSVEDYNRWVKEA